MNRRFDSEHEPGISRTAFEALRAARPRVPAEWTSVDTQDGEKIFWRIVGDEQTSTQHRFRRSRFTIAVGVAAAAAVVGVLIALPSRGTPVSVGEGARTEAVATTATSEPAADLWPEIAPSPAIGEHNTTRANLLTTTNDGIPVYPETYTLVDGDVSILIELDPTNGLRNVVEHRYIGGEWYAHYPDAEQDSRWEHGADPDTIPSGLSPSDPRELYERLSPTAGFEADGTDFIFGLEAVHLIAGTPDAIDQTLLPFGDQILDLVALDLWVDSNGIVRGVDITFVNPWVDGSLDPVVVPPGSDPNVEYLVTYSVQYYAIGEPMTIDVPRDAVEIDANG